MPVHCHLFIPIYVQLYIAVHYDDIGILVITELNILSINFFNELILNQQVWEMTLSFSIAKAEILTLKKIQGV